MVGFGGNRFWRHCRDPNSTPRHSVGARRRRVRLCRPTHAARHPPIQTCLQHEVSRNLCRLCCDHVDLRTNNHWDSFGFALGQHRYNRADLFARPATGKFASGHCCGSKLFGSFCEPLRSRARWPCNAFCDATSPRWSAALAQPIRSASARATIRERTAFRAWCIDEAACCLLRFVWSYLSRGQG